MAAPFLLFFQGRTGSGWIMSLLGQHPDVSIRMEWLHRFATAAEQEEAALAFYAGAEPGIKAIGFKEQLSNIRDPDALAEPLAGLDGFVPIMMARRNLVKESISQLRVKALAERYGRANLRKGEQPVEPTELDVAELQRMLTRRRQRREHLEAFVQRHFPDAHRMFYEDALADTIGVLRRLCDVLGVDAGFAFTLEATEFVKNTDNDLRKVLVNYDEIARALDGTEWAPMLAQ